MTAWEEFEEYLFDRDLLGEEFNAAAVAEDQGISVAEASRFLQVYQDAQNRKNSKTLFVIRRVAGTRTTNAIWHVGARSADARGMAKQWKSDARRRIERVIEPTLVRVAEKNPRALPAAQAVLKGIEACLDMMEALLDGDGS